MSENAVFGAAFRNAIEKPQLEARGIRATGVRRSLGWRNSPGRELRRIDARQRCDPRPYQGAAGVAATRMRAWPRCLRPNSTSSAPVHSWPPKP